MTSTTSDVTILGRDEDGSLVAESEGLRYYLTTCCEASVTGSDEGVVCRACHRWAPASMGGAPKPVTRPRTWFCQVRPNAGEAWLTTDFGTQGLVDAWRTQVAPRKRAQGLQTRVILDVELEEEEADFQAYLDEQAAIEASPLLQAIL